MEQEVLDDRYQRIIERLNRHDFERTEQIILLELKARPLDAQLWVYLGYTLLQQGYAVSARRTYERAYLLDPQATWIENVLAGITGNRNKKSIDKVLQVKQVTVTAGILVKNEERTIARCISSILDAVDEIVVIDTGSTDQTIEIIKSFPKVKVVEFSWCNDFSAARNYGLLHMNSSWVIWVDADEYLHEHDKDSIRTVASLYNICNPPAILKVGQLNQIGEATQINYEQSRMFPLGHGIQYYGRVHEQAGSVNYTIDEIKYIRMPVRIRLYHDGYQPSIMEQKKKLVRNVGLLKQMILEDPENPTWLVFLGRELLSLNEHPREGIEILCRAEEKASEKNRDTLKLFILSFLIKAYLQIEDLDNAESACNRALNIDPNYPDAMYYLSQIKLYQAKKLYQHAEDNAINSRKAYQLYRGVVSADPEIIEWKANSILADIALFSGNILKARSIYQEVLVKRPNLDSALMNLQYIEIVRKDLNKV